MERRARIRWGVIMTYNGIELTEDNVFIDISIVRGDNDTWYHKAYLKLEGKPLDRQTPIGLIPIFARSLDELVLRNDH